MSKRGEKTVWDAENKRSATPLDKSDAEIKKLIKPIGEGNECVVLAEGTRIVYSINGQVTTDMTDNSPKACKSGVIGLQVHGGFTMTIQFKGLKIKMLPAAAKQDKSDPNGGAFESAGVVSCPRRRSFRPASIRKSLPHIRRLRIHKVAGSEGGGALPGADSIGRPR